MWKSLFLVAITFSASFGISTAAELPPGFDRYTDDALKNLPSNIETLSLRGSSGYGVDEISDEGFAEVSRFRELRVLKAGALGLTDAALKTVGDLPNLEELSLDGNHIQGSELHHLTKLKKLKKLNLSFNPLGDEWANLLSQLNTLEELQVVNYDRPLNDTDLQELSKLKNLTRLDLTDKANGVTDAGLAAIASLKSLTSLSLSEASLSSDGLAQLAELKRMQRLRLHSLRGIVGGSLSWISQLQGLQELEISGTALNNNDLESINKLSQLQNLLVWNASGSGDNLQIEHLDGLASLRAIRTNEILTPSALRDLSKIESIEYIGDDLTMISDTELVELANLPRLRSITLDSPLVTEKALDSLKRMKSLRYLCVSDKVKLTADQLQNLGRESLIDCQIVARTGGVIYYEPRGTKVNEN
jgi:Leucine-rich repeat (LRR) protein